MATNPNTFIGLGMPSELANAVSAAIDAAGGGGGDSVAWDDVTDKPAVIAAGESATAARNAIEAGTSSLQIGTSGTTAMAGNATPTPADNSVTNAKVAASAAIALNKLANTAAITTAGGTSIPAGTLQATLQAIANIADPEVE